MVEGFHRYYPVVSHRSVYDGDTFTLVYESNKDDKHNYDLSSRRIRLNRIDCWEMRGEEREKGKLAKQFTQDFLSGAEELRVEFFGRGSYGRKIADIYGRFGAEWRCLSDELVSNGHGVYKDY